MRPRLQRHSTVRHRPEHLSEGLRGCTEFLLKHYLPALVQHAIPTPTIPQIQSHDVFLLRKVPALLLCHSDTLPHSRSPFVLRLERVITGSLSHPAWRPAFSSHLIYINYASRFRLKDRLCCPLYCGQCFLRVPLGQIDLNEYSRLHKGSLPRTRFASERAGGKYWGRVLI